MIYKAIEVAKYIVDKCTKEKTPISNLHLQKILYFIQKEYLKKGLVAFSDDLEAWQFGPVVPSVYYRFCGAGAMPITLTYDDISIMENDRAIMDPIIETRKKQKPWNLVAETHKPKGAWDQTYQEGNGDRTIIPLKLIREEE